MGKPAAAVVVAGLGRAILARLAEPTSPGLSLVSSSIPRQEHNARGQHRALKSGMGLTPALGRNSQSFAALSG